MLLFHGSKRHSICQRHVKIRVSVVGVDNDPVAIGHFAGPTQTLEGLGESDPVTMSD